MKTASQVRQFCYLAAALLAFVIISVSIMGVRDYIVFKKTVEPGLGFSEPVLKLFTRQALMREWQKVTASKLPETDQIPSFYLYLGEADIASLNSDLPVSGKSQFIPGHLDAPKFNFASGGDFRYRGGLPLHWLYEKKSYRVKLPPFKQLNGDQTFNLVNPSTIHTLTDLIMYDLSRGEGLLAPDYLPARVFVNDRYKGLHFYLSEVDESLLRKHDRMPGSIYSGDTIYSPGYFGDENSIHQEGVYVDDSRLALFWSDPRLWKKDSSRNAEKKKNREDIQQYVALMNAEDPVDFYSLFNRYLDKEKYYTFWGLDTLFGGYHHDNFHNHKIYFDPYKGKFEPIQWDFRFWSTFSGKDIPVNPLIAQVSLNPVLEFERDLRTAQLFERYTVDHINKIIDQHDALLKPELASDPFRQTPDHRFVRFQLAKVRPFSIPEYERAIGELKQTYLRRRDFVNVLLSDSRVSYKLALSGRVVTLVIAVDGNTPVKFSLEQLLGQGAGTVHKVYGGSKVSVDNQKTELLYPGRTRVEGNVVGRMDNWSVTAFGNYRFVPSPLLYRYEIEAGSQVDFETLKSLHFKFTNAVTNEVVEAHLVEELPSDAGTLSLHPWELEAHQASPKSVILSGKVNVDEDLIFSGESSVRIMPGTEFTLAPGASIFFGGKVTAEGTSDRPIIFRSRDGEAPWGAIVVQGSKAAGSSFSFVQLSGGSVATFNLIDYPGVFNIHDVPEFVLSDCVIRDTHVGDDGLHLAYSKGKVERCSFFNTAFDAIDIDISSAALNEILIEDAGNDGLDVMTSNISLHDIRVKSAGDKCISIGERSSLSLKDGFLGACSIGIAVKDESIATLDGVKFGAGEGSSIALYRKNTRYGKGGEVRGVNLSGLSLQEIDVGPYSKSYISEADIN